MSFFSHAGHLHDSLDWLKWIGQFHLVILHFPIALLLMASVAECGKSLFFQNSARFLIHAGALTAIPTALLGLAYSYHTTYSDLFQQILWWHGFSGLTTAALAILVALFKELHLRKIVNRSIYLVTLALLIIFVFATGYLGGTLSFGFLRLLPS